MSSVLPDVARVTQVTCEFTFDSSHQLRRPEWDDAQNDAVFGKCARLHGHTYRLRVTMAGRVDAETGMVINFTDLKRIVKAEVIVALDHRHLNDVLDELTTAENVIGWIADRLLTAFADAPARLHRLDLWETPSSFVTLDVDALQSHFPPFGPPPGRGFA